VRRGWASLAFIMFIAPAALGGVAPVIMVGCFDGQTYPVAYMANYTRELVKVAEEYVRSRYGESVYVVGVGDWSFLLDALTFPNVIGAVVALNVREGGQLYLSPLRTSQVVSSFERGLGLVGIQGLGYSPYCGRISREVFPLDANLSAAGRLSRVPVTTLRHTHEKASNHPVNAQAPDRFDAADGMLVYRKPGGEGAWWTPEEGNLTVLYVCKTVGGYSSVPSVVAYEREQGRSVTFAGLKHTDGFGKYEKDLTYYNHSLGIPAVRQIIGESLAWAVQPFAEGAGLKARMEASSAFFAENLGPLFEKMRMAEEAKARQENRVQASVLLLCGASGVAILAIAYLGFARG